jgi:hypothetical protein
LAIAWPLEKAKAFVHRLGLDTVADWRAYVFGDMPWLADPPPNIPTNPNFTYKGEGWVNYGDWLGNGRAPSVVPVSAFWDYERVRVFVGDLGLSGLNEWRAYVRGEMALKKPLNLNRFKAIRSKKLLKSKGKRSAAVHDSIELPTIYHDHSDVTAEKNSALAPNEICRRMGVSRTTLQTYREKRVLLGLPKGRSRSVYPEWQLDESGQPIAEIKTILDLLDPIVESPVEKLIQILAKSEFFGGKSIKDFIVERDLERAVKSAEMRVHP